MSDWKRSTDPHEPVYISEEGRMTLMQHKKDPNSYAVALDGRKTPVTVSLNPYRKTFGIHDHPTGMNFGGHIATKDLEWCILSIVDALQYQGFLKYEEEE